MEKERAQFIDSIQQNLGAYAQVLSSVQNDPAQTQFYQSLDAAINTYNEISNMIHQGSTFYQRLCEILNQLYQK